MGAHSTLAAAALSVAMLMGACSSDEGSSTSTTPEPTFAAIDCPVADDVFCTTATAVLNALAARDANALLALSRTDTIVCEQMNTEYFPGCAEQDVLTGHGLSGPDLVVEVVPEAVYLDELRKMVAIDPATLEIIGIGTCGPDVSGQRAYHVSWTAEHSADESAGAAVVGSFELLFVGVPAQ